MAATITIGFTPEGKEVPPTTLTLAFDDQEKANQAIKKLHSEFTRISRGDHSIPSVTLELSGNKLALVVLAKVVFAHSN